MSGFWYLVKVLPGKERQLKEQFNTEIELGTLKNVIRFECPLEKQYKVIKSKKVIREKVIYTGYLYFETDHELDDDELKYLSHLPHIMSIIGDRRPVKLRDSEIRKILNEGNNEITNESIEYKVGEIIKVVEGPFNTFEGEIRFVEGNKVDVDVKIFGRATKVSLTKEQIEKI